jgi:hypothetical protein
VAPVVEVPVVEVPVLVEVPAVGAESSTSLYKDHAISRRAKWNILEYSY